MSAVAKLGAVLLIAAALGAGYWWGARDAAPRSVMPAAPPGESAPQTGGRKILYYRNPMGLPDTSPVPKKDPMGMDYVPVYEGEDAQAPGSAQLNIGTQKVQKLGVRTEQAAMRVLTRNVRAVGTLAVDERRMTTVAPRFEGWIERLHVNTTGQAVAAGAPLMEVYSPDLVTAQQEYLIAARGVETMKDAAPEVQASMRRMMTGALERLRNWEISERELAQLEREGAIRRTVTLRSPVGGVVVEKPALKGMRFMPGDALYQISDLSALWVLADVFEQDLALVQPGQSARITVDALPGRVFNGRVAFLYPTLAAETRTGRLRIELPNPGGVLKLGMYAGVEIAAGQGSKRLAVPISAVIDSGVRRIVLVQRGEGRFEPREVKLGMRADDYVEVLEGVKDGEPVVVAANFLIDAESNLKAAIGAMTAPDASAGSAATPAGAPVGHRGEGTLDAVDAKSATATITHGPIASLKWPSMTMEFALANAGLAAQVKPGTPIEFEFVERKPGDYVVTRMNAKRAPGREPHAGH
ncbi:MAG: efflux RND transporter periplasmic adaptor subunit [Burkholderiales bacterium]|nr:efflux RND transporter periplasmic adaptor subunit [Burkholderiales bacterium]